MQHYPRAWGAWWGLLEPPLPLPAASPDLLLQGGRAWPSR